MRMGVVVHPAEAHCTRPSELIVMLRIMHTLAGQLQDALP